MMEKANKVTISCHFKYLGDVSKMMDPFYITDSAWDKLQKEVAEHPEETTDVLKSMNGLNKINVSKDKMDKINFNKISKEESVSDKLLGGNKVEKNKSVFVVLSGNSEDKIHKFLEVVSNKKIAKSLFGLDVCKKVKKNVYVDDFGKYYKIKKVEII